MRCAVQPWITLFVSEASQRAEIRSHRDLVGERLLLAEDNPINREVALELLHGAGLAVEAAVDDRFRLPGGAGDGA